MQLSFHLTAVPIPELLLLVKCITDPYMYKQKSAELALSFTLVRTGESILQRSLLVKYFRFLNDSFSRRKKNIHKCKRKNCVFYPSAGVRRIYKRFVYKGGTRTFTKTRMYYCSSKDVVQAGSVQNTFYQYSAVHAIVEDTGHIVNHIPFGLSRIVSSFSNRRLATNCVKKESTAELAQNWNAEENILTDRH